MGYREVEEEEAEESATSLLIIDEPQGEPEKTEANGQYLITTWIKKKDASI